MPFVAAPGTEPDRTANIDAGQYAAGEKNDAMNRVSIRANYFVPAYYRLVQRFTQEEPALSIDSKKMCSHYEWELRSSDTFYLAVMRGIRNGLPIGEMKLVANFVNPDGTVDDDDESENEEDHNSCNECNHWEGCLDAERSRSL
jgi:hypothetical protein